MTIYVNYIVKKYYLVINVLQKITYDIIRYVFIYLNSLW